MSWEYGVEGNDTIRIGNLDTTVESSIQVRLISRVTVAACHNTGVNTCSVAVPGLEVYLWDWVARVDIDDLDVERQGNSALAICHVFTDEFARDPVRALGRLRCKDTAVVTGEKNRGISVVRGNASQVGLVACVENRVKVTGAEEGLICLTF